MSHSPTLRLTEIYASIQGESSFAGVPCTFIRLTGCPLRCRWCDTAYAFAGGEEWTVADIVTKVLALKVPLVELTGGEPLAQAAAPELIGLLQAEGLQVLIETSGAEDIAVLPAATHVIMDLKCPGSGMEERNLWRNLEHLKPSDEIKFVLAHRADYDWARAVIAREDLAERFHVLFSCAWGLLAPKDLAAWLVEDPVRCRMQLQQHKYIWGPRAKGV
ncbi:MAG: radical SAM protein [Proteobacteria bacterium]|nr:radical SAM protein [Pseudomonadota bacterium]